MTTEDPLKNWQLQQGDETADQWKLQDAEQNLNKNMQLQEGGPPEPQWQPVEYQREVRPRRRGGWILPSIVILALLGVLGYVGWVALGQGGANPLDPGAIAGLAPGATEQTPPATSEAAAPPTPAPATATPEPTATPSPEATATATTPPTPEITTVELISGTVNSPDGVNARSTPDTAGEVLLLLPQNAGVTVVAEENDWVQVILPDNRVAWVSAQFVDRTSQQVAPEVLAQIYTDAGLPPPALPPSASATPEAAPAPTEISFAAIVTGDPSVNARGAPQVDGIVVTSLAKDTAVSAIGRSADNLWIALRLADGKPAWVLREFVSSGGSFDTLPVVDPAALIATVP
ncbi:MAG: SH3 domain-containing protein [Anaerolineales bacterium]|nr:SH3 domain-containing protein [Anaerolineales bacterium]